MLKPLALKIFSFFLIFFATTTLTISYIPTHLSRIASIISLFILLTYFASNRKKIHFIRSNVYILFLYLFIISYVLFLNIITPITDFVVLTRLTSILTDGVPTALLISFCLLKKNEGNDNATDASFTDFTHYFYLSSILISFTVLISVLSPDFRQLISSIFPAQGNITDPDHPDYAFRVRGILPATGATASVYFALGFLFGFYYLAKESKKNSYYSLLLCLGMILVFASVILNGRTGILIIAISALIYTTYMLFKIAANININNKNREKIKCKALTVILIIISAIAYGLMLFHDSPALVRLLSDFITIVSSGGRDGTTGALLNMIVIPSDTKTLFIGDLTTYSASRINSDIGYVRFVNAIGIIGCMLFYGFWLLAGISTQKSKIPRSTKLFITLIFALMFIIEMKEPFLSYLYVSSTLITIFSIVSLQPKGKYNSNGQKT